MLRNETLFVLIRKQRCCYTNLENQTALTNIIRDMILNSEINEFDVIIVGGGATGAGTARDCALRGMRNLLPYLPPPHARQPKWTRDYKEPQMDLYPDGI